MNQATPVSTNFPASFGRKACWLALVLVAGWAVVASNRALANARRTIPGPVELPMLALERRDGRLWRRGSTTPFDGIMTEHHPMGRIKSRTSVVAGLLDGVSEGFFASGEPQVIEYFKQGVQNGPRTTWRSGGQMQSQGTMLGGKQEGTFRRWHENGALEIEAEFKDGKPDGLSRSWYSSGFLKAEASMVRGEVSDRRAYEDGQRQQPVLLARTNNP